MMLFGNSGAMEGMKASLAQKIRGVAEEQKIKEQCQKQARLDYVRSDPLKLYLKEDTDDHHQKSQSSSHPSASGGRSLRHHGKRRKGDDIFKDFGKEHDSNVLVTVDGKTKINYKLFSQSDPDLGRWRQALGDNSRYDTLLSDVRRRWHEDYKVDRAELTQRHNALFRQRHAVESKEVGENKVKNSSPAVVQLKELQKTLEGRNTKSKRNGARHGTASKLDKLNPFHFVDESPKRSYGEEQVISFVTFCLQQYGNLTTAFHKIDNNHSDEVSFLEFTDIVATLGYRGDVKFLFYKLDLNGDGILDIHEFMNLKPYMLKEMVRVSMLYMESRNNRLLSDVETLWLKFAVTELKDLGMLEQMIQATGSNVCPDPESLESTQASLPGFGAASQGSDDSFVERQETRPNSPISNLPLIEDVEDTTHEGSQQMARGKEMPKLPQTMSLFIFRNADRTHSGVAVFVKNFPSTVDRLVKICAQSCQPVVGPADSLISWSPSDGLRPVRSLEQITKGGVYLLKGKEALDPPPHFFVQRHPPPVVSFRSLSDVQIASRTEANSRPCTSPLRPATATSTRAPSSLPEFTDSSSTILSMSRVGSPPQSSFCLPVAGGGICFPMKTWQAEVRLNKHLTYGGKNLPPAHKRYDLWKALPRVASESDVSRVDRARTPVY